MSSSNIGRPDSPTNKHNLHHQGSEERVENKSLASMPRTITSPPRRWRPSRSCCLYTCGWALNILGALFCVLFIIIGVYNLDNPNPDQPPRYHRVPSKPTRVVQTHYEVLNLSPGLSHRDLRANYKSLVKHFHPDKLPAHFTPAQVKGHTDEFERIRKSYDYLTGPRRCEYAFIHGVDIDAVLECCHQVLAEQVRDWKNTGRYATLLEMRTRSALRLGTTLEEIPGFQDLLWKYWPLPEVDRPAGKELTMSYPKALVVKARSVVSRTVSIVLAIPDTVWKFSRWVFGAGGSA